MANSAMAKQHHPDPKPDHDREPAIETNRESAAPPTREDTRQESTELDQVRSILFGSMFDHLERRMTALESHVEQTSATLRDELGGKITQSGQLVAQLEHALREEARHRDAAVQSIDQRVQSQYDGMQSKLVDSADAARRSLSECEQRLREVIDASSNALRSQIEAIDTARINDIETMTKENERTGSEKVERKAFADMLKTLAQQLDNNAQN